MSDSKLTPNPVIKGISTVKRKTKCQAKTKAGKSCAAPATPSGFCNLHSDPEKAAKLGRQGGLQNRHIVPVSGDKPLAVPRTGGEIREMLAQTIAEVKLGHTDPRIGTALAYMASSLLKAIEIEELESRLRRLQSKCRLDQLGISEYDKPRQK